MENYDFVEEIYDDYINGNITMAMDGVKKYGTYYFFEDFLDYLREIYNYEEAKKIFPEFVIVYFEEKGEINEKIDNIEEN